MLLSVNTEIFYKEYSDEESIRLIKKAGFDAFDLSLFKMKRDSECPFNKENYRDYALHLRNIADEIGIVCNQAHAPFPSSCGDIEKDEQTFNLLVRAMEIASIVGAKIIIIHPYQHLHYIDNKEALKQINLDFYKRLLPYCEKFGIKIATENMWQKKNNNTHIIDSVCSRVDEFCEYIDMIDSEWFTACLDIGHVPLVDEQLPRMIKGLGHNRLQALHVHDNNLSHDCHTMPFLMNINFEEVTKALAEIDYVGDFTFEAEGFFKNMPKELLFPAAKLLCETGRYLIKRIEEHKNTLA